MIEGKLVENLAGWKTFKFGECAELINGRAYSQHELLPTGQYKVIRIQNLNGGSNWYYSDMTLEDEKYCDDGDLLFAWSATFGPYIWQGDKAIFHYHIWKVKPNPELLDKQFAYYLLLWITEDIKAGAHGIAMLHFTKVGMEAHEVSIPKLSLQCQIADSLNAQFTELETARQAAQAQLDNARLLRARMLKAFFAELNSTPKKRLGDHAQTTSGSTPSRGNKQYWEPAEIAWVKTGEVAFAPINGTEEAISNLALAECSLTLLPPKTILIAMYGQGKTRGQSAILEIPATTNQACFAIMPNETWEPDFLYLWLKASYQDLRDLSADRGGNQANLNGTLLKSLEIPAPEITIQQNLVKRIQLALAEVDALEQSSKAALSDIEKLPARILAQAFENS